MLKPKMLKPKMFIASSVESLSIAYAIQENLSPRDSLSTVWTQGIFDLSKTTLESLLDKIKDFDYGIFVFSPDDEAKIRGEKFKITRDNIVFELGLFIGSLGKERCFIVAPTVCEEEIHFPSDLLGITPARYEHFDNDDELIAVIGPLCNQIRRVIKKYGNIRGTANKKESYGDLTQIKKNKKINLSVRAASLTVVVGDRRESPPETPGDFFAGTASSRDLTWLLTIGLPQNTEIWNDKIVSATSTDSDVPEYLRSSDLLIIGSPYCNLLARHVNKLSFFRFNIKRRILERIEAAEEKIKGIDRKENVLLKYYNDLGPKYTELLIQLRGVGLVDPLKCQDHIGVVSGKNHDWGTITVCKHPYSNKAKAIMIAGHHLPATMSAIRFLKDPDNFLKRPLGGIIKVTMPEGRWYERLTRATCEWFTPEYTINDLKKSFTKNNELYKDDREYDDFDLKNYQNLLSSLSSFSLYNFLNDLLIR